MFNAPKSPCVHIKIILIPQIIQDNHDFETLVKKRPLKGDMVTAQQCSDIAGMRYLTSRDYPHQIYESDMAVEV